MLQFELYVLADLKTQVLFFAGYILHSRDTFDSEKIWLVHQEGGSVLWDSTEARNQDDRDRYSLYYETVQRLVTRMTETGTA